MRQELKRPLPFMPLQTLLNSNTLKTITGTIMKGEEGGHTSTHTHTDTLTHTLSLSHRYTHTHAHTHTHTHTHSHTHTHTHTHTHAHAHTHTRTHTRYREFPGDPGSLPRCHLDVPNGPHYDRTQIAALQRNHRFLVQKAHAHA